MRLSRERIGLSREQVAVDTGRSYSTIVSYETGRIAPPAAALARLADLYGVDVGFFFSDEPVSV